MVQFLDVLTEARYDLHPQGESSQVYLKAMNEAFDPTELMRLRRQGEELGQTVRKFPWQQDLQQWPPVSMRNFGRVAFYRMFSSATQRGFVDKERQLSDAQIRQEHEKWVHGHIMVQEYIKRGQHPTFERIRRLNEVFGTRMRKNELVERFSCFNVPDLPEATGYFDSWYQGHAGKIWPIQLATLSAAYLIEVHPFENANGRTARFVLDWILGLNGLPPACFSDRLQALLSRSPNKWNVNHVTALAKVMTGMENTMKILQGIDIHEAPSA